MSSRGARRRAVAPQGSNDPSTRALVEARFAQISFSGPVPIAAELARYEEILPGAAKIIFGMAQQQARHRQRMERAYLDADLKAQRLGLIAATGLSAMLLVLGFLLVLTGHQEVGLGAGGSDLAILAGAFLYGTRSRRREREARARIMLGEDPGDDGLSR